ncbi:MAG: outer membrane lipoprotein-sorting protein [Candidatus Neomarinimicrobiota bacterium]
MTAREIMLRVDNQPEPKSMIATTQMTLVTVKRGTVKERVREITRHQRNYTSGEFASKSLIRFQQPADVKGTGFLMWEYNDDRDDDQWLFLPALGKVKRIVAREKGENFMGSDFTYEDMSGRDIEDDHFTLLGEEKLGAVDCYKIEAVPITGETSYRRRVTWIDKEKWLAIRVEFYDQKQNNLLKVLTIDELRKNGPYWTVLKMRMENVQTEHKTLMDISDVQYDTGIRDDFFTERFLMRVD